MTTALFVTMDAGGNVPPALAIARRFVLDGGTARVIGPRGTARLIQGTGLEFETAPHAASFDPAAHAGTLTGLRGYLRAFLDRGLAQDVLDSLRRQSADLVVADCMLLPVLRSVTEAGFPVIPLVHSLPQYFTGNWARGPIGVAAGLRGLRPRQVWAAPRGAIVTALPELCDASGFPGAHLAGPIWQDGAASAPATPGPRPRLLVSLSTNWFPGQDRALQHILDAASELHADLLVTTGPAIDPATLNAPPNAEVVRFAVHNEVMPRMDAVLSHGGHGTTMRALAHGLPLAIMPMNPFLDQPLIGKLVRDRGAGVLLKRTARPARISAVLNEMLAPARYPAYRSAAQRLQRQILRHDALAEAAARLLAVAGS